MQVAVVNDKAGLVAHFAAERPDLGEAEMVRIAGRRPQNRQDCEATNLRCALSRYRFGSPIVRVDQPATLPFRLTYGIARAGVLPQDATANSRKRLMRKEKNWLRLANTRWIYFYHRQLITTPKQFGLS